jgi:hypothetical protein
MHYMVHYELYGSLALNVKIVYGSSSIINEYQTNFNENGTAQFQKLGFYNEATNVSVLYTLVSSLTM